MKITGTDGAVMGSSWNGDGASCLRLESAGLVPAARDDAGGTRPRVVQPTVRAALRMTAVTAPGSLIMDRCGALISVTCDPARRAITTCSAGGMTWSAVPMTSQDGIVCQAGVVVSVSDRMLATGGCCSAASAAPSLAGRPLAKHPGNTLWLTYANASPEGAPG